MRTVLTFTHHPMLLATRASLDVLRFRPSTQQRFSAFRIAVVGAAHLLVIALLAVVKTAPNPPAVPVLTVRALALPLAAAVVPASPTPATARAQPTERKTAVRPPRPAPTPLPTLQSATASDAAPTGPTTLPPDPALPVPAPGSGVPANPAGESAAPPSASPPRFDAAYLRNPAPVYPPQARRLGEQGKVVLRVLVNAHGQPARIEIRSGSGSTRLDEAALDAVRHWQFVPARRGDETLDAWVLVPIVFNLKN